MKKTSIIIVILGVLSLLVYWGIEMYIFEDGVRKTTIQKELLPKSSKLQNGDIIFQTSQSNQSKAILISYAFKVQSYGHYL
jgi:hypothetical protein